MPHCKHKMYCVFIIIFLKGGGSQLIRQEMVSSVLFQ